jgi:hypothetical protein
MALADAAPGLEPIDAAFRRIVVVFNATRKDQQVRDDAFKGGAFVLHPVQAASADPRLRQAAFDAGPGQFKVPARTAAVFVETE